MYVHITTKNKDNKIKLVTHLLGPCQPVQQGKVYSVKRTDAMMEGDRVGMGKYFVKNLTRTKEWSVHIERDTYIRSVWMKTSTQFLVEQREYQNTIHLHKHGAYVQPLAFQILCQQF